MQDRGLAAYITELVGTFFLVFFICSVLILYVATGAQATDDSSGSLPFTGSGVLPFAAIGVLGLVAGLAIRRMTRRVTRAGV